MQSVSIDSLHFVITICVYLKDVVDTDGKLRQHPSHRLVEIDVASVTSAHAAALRQTG